MAIDQSGRVRGPVDSIGIPIDPNMDLGWITQLTRGGAIDNLRKPRVELPLSFVPAPSLRSALFGLFGSLPVFMTEADAVDSEGIAIDPNTDPGWIAQLTGGGATLLPRPAAEPLTIGIPKLPPQEVTEQGFGGIPGLGLPSLMRTWGTAFTGLAFTGCVVGLCYLLRQPGLGQRVLAFARI